MTQPLSAEELLAKAKTSGRNLKFYIRLGPGGLFRSSKEIKYESDRRLYRVYSHIDDTEALLSAEQFTEKYESIVQGNNKKGAKIFWLEEN